MFDKVGALHILIAAVLTLGLYHVRRLLAAAQNASRRGHFVLELTEVALAAIFLLVGGAKLIGQREMILLFRQIGVGEWFRYLTGTVEVSGALLLLIPYLSGVSAIGLGAVMIVASLVELFVLHRPPVAALACLTAHAFVSWSRVSRTSATVLNRHLEIEDVRSTLTRGFEARWTFPRWVRVVAAFGAESPESNADRRRKVNL